MQTIQVARALKKYFFISPSTFFEFFRTKNSMQSDVLIFQKIFVKFQARVIIKLFLLKRVYFTMIVASLNNPLFRVSNMEKLYCLLRFHYC